MQLLRWSVITGLQFEHDQMPLKRPLAIGSCYRDGLGIWSMLYLRKNARGQVIDRVWRQCRTDQLPSKLKIEALLLGIQL